MTAEISFGGLATGLPTEDLVTSLMAIERQPIDRLEASKENESQRLQAYKSLDDLLDELRTAAGDMNITSEVQTTSVKLSSDANISASSSGASLGSYDIAVAQLAQVQKTVSEGYSSTSDPIFGTGFFGINDTGITIDESNNSLDGLADAINSVSDDTGVTASIINDGNTSNNYHLVLTGKDASTSFTHTASFKDESGDPINFSADDLRTAQQAIAYVDGIEVVSNTNTLTGVIAGLTISLNEVSEVITPAQDGNPAEYATTTLNVEADTDSLKEKISTFVSAYNGIMDWISSGYDEAAIAAAQAESTNSDASSSDTTSSAELSSILRGDATVNDIKRGLQSILTNAVGGSGSFQILSELGISTRRDGSLNLNSATLNTKIENNFNDVVKLLAGESGVDGVMKNFNNYLLDVTSSSSGMYADKKDRYEQATGRLDDQINQKESAMIKIEDRIRAQFNAMELLVSNLNAQGDYLTQQMDILANLSKGNN